MKKGRVHLSMVGLGMVNPDRLPLLMRRRPDVDSSHALQNHQDIEKPCPECCCLLTGVHLLPLCAVGPVD